MVFQALYESPVSLLLLKAEGECLTEITYLKEKPEGFIENSNACLAKTIQQLSEYFKSERKQFTVPLTLKGTDFQVSVWQALQEIPHGETASYKKLAEMIGNPKAVRAVGGANNRNPISIIVPCHRIIGADGSLVGYAGGLSIKNNLLVLESS